jgi:uncharacterized membrane protein YcaP (DUF421 family)
MLDADLAIAATKEAVMFTPSVGIGELMLRALIVYAFVFGLLRLVGKRHVGEMAPFDLIVLLLISESVHNAIISDDKSVTGGFIAFATLFAVNALVGYASWRNKAIGHFFSGRPRILVRNGRVLRDALRSEQINPKELLEALRHGGCTSLTRVRYAVLENDGSITVGLRVKRRP